MKGESDHCNRCHCKRMCLYLCKCVKSATDSQNLASNSSSREGAAWRLIETNGRKNEDERERPLGTKESDRASSQHRLFDRSEGWGEETFRNIVYVLKIDHRFWNKPWSYTNASRFKSLLCPTHKFSKPPWSVRPHCPRSFSSDKPLTLSSQCLREGKQLE